jgi:hypothetical protein
MGRPRKRPASQGRPAEDEIRNQEVLRANRELAAYFKGRRTEREARAALKIIKAFVRDRERADPAARRPLPIVGAAKESTVARVSAASGRPRRRILRSVPSHAPAPPSTVPDSSRATPTKAEE